ncbi:MAG: glutamyl-tRNA reductase [Verrucomicrobiota bacterium]|jgi:glutamyl-tRNA reductase
MSIVVVGLSHRSAPVELRERFAFADAGVPAALQELRSAGIAAEGVVLSTCNRVEIYAATPLPAESAFAEIKKFFVAHHAYDGALGDELYTLAEPLSLQHLFRVASGLDSMVIGETEIFGQLKKAYDLAFTHKHTGALLNRAFQRAFNVAKHIRTETNIQRGSVSVMSAAVELAEKIFTSLADHEVLVIGAGETSEKTARALQSRGVRQITVTNRSPERAAALAAELGARTVPFEQWPEEFGRIDIAISSTAARQPILDRARLEPLMKRRRHRPLLLIDIAVPRDIDPAVNALENVYLYNVDDLQGIADDYLKLRQEEVARCEQIIAEKVAALLESLRRSGAEENR